MKTPRACHHSAHWHNAGLPTKRQESMTCSSVQPVRGRPSSRKWSTGQRLRTPASASRRTEATLAQSALAAAAAGRLPCSFCAACSMLCAASCRPSWIMIWPRRAMACPAYHTAPSGPIPFYIYVYLSRFTACPGLDSFARAFWAWQHSNMWIVCKGHPSCKCMVTQMMT